MGMDLSINRFVSNIRVASLFFFFLKVLLFHGKRVTIPHFQGPLSVSAVFGEKSVRGDGSDVPRVQKYKVYEVLQSLKCFSSHCSPLDYI